jgi:hypothetical protein
MGEHVFRLFENRVVRRIIGHKEDISVGRLEKTA